MLIKEINLDSLKITNISEPTDIMVDGNEYHLAEYVPLEGSIALNSVHEPLMVNGVGVTPSRVEDGSHYTFYGSSEVVESENLFNKNDVVDGYLLKSDNSTTQDGNYFYSNYIKVESGGTYTYNLGISFYTCFYNSNKTFVSGGTYSSNFTIPTNAVYMRISATNVRKDTLSITKGSVAPTQYTPYFEPFIQNLGELGEDGNYYIPLGDKLINIGSQPLRQGEIKCTDGRRTRLKGGYTFTGNENISLMYTTNNIYSFFIQIGKNDIWKPINNSTSCEGKIKATFNVANYTTTNGIVGGLRNGLSISTTGVIVLAVDGLTTLEAIKNYIKNQTIEYDLATPTTEIGEAYELPSGLVEGQNLFTTSKTDNTRWIIDNTYIKCNIINDILTVEKKSVAPQQITQAVYIDSLLEDGETYTIRAFKVSESGSNMGGINIAINTTLGYRYSAINIGYKFTYKSGGNTSYIYIQYSADSDIIGSAQFKIMLVKGENVPLEYTPHIADEEQRYKVNATTIESVAIDGNVTHINQVIGSVTDNINLSDFEILNLNYNNYKSADIHNLPSNIDDILSKLSNTQKNEYLSHYKALKRKANVTPQLLPMPSTTTATQCNVDIIGNVDGIDIRYAKQK